MSLCAVYDLGGGGGGGYSLYAVYVWGVVVYVQCMSGGLLQYLSH